MNVVLLLVLVVLTSDDVSTTEQSKPGCLPIDPRIQCIWFNDQCKGNDANCPKGEICCDGPCGTSCVKPVCELAKKTTKQCSGGNKRTLWYYDNKKGRCCKFKKRECGGVNENSFASKTQCNNVKSACVCRLPMEPGKCRAFISRYYYNTVTNKCEKFIYGGCQGNKNNFKSLVACKRTCGEHPPRMPPSPPPRPPQHPPTRPPHPLPQNPPVKPGTCKQVGSRAGICLSECSNDDECKGTDKCCSNGCGHVCMPPVLPIMKPGFCPRVPPKTAGICADMCTGDDSCPGNKKCCSNGCGKVCMPPVVPILKPGLCPAVSQNTATKCGTTCSSDSSCPGNEKCCSNGCGGFDCKSPSEPPPRPSPSPAPAPRPSPSPAPATRPSPSPAPHQPSPSPVPNQPSPSPPQEPPTRLPPRRPVPIIVKPGSCQNRSRVGICANECSQDGECSGADKCCLNGCGNICMSPILPIVKPGVCPSLPPNSHVRCNNTCSSDDSCPGNEKCCSNGCGYDCKAPTSGVEPPIPPQCNVGSPLKSGTRVVNCGEGTNKQKCPTGYHCNGGICCLEMCRFGLPLSGIFCGRGPGHQECPAGFSCNISPIDAFAVCCPIALEP